MRTQFSVLVLCCLALFSTSPVQAGETTLAVIIAPECSIGIVSLSTANENSHTVTFNYKLRTAGAGQGQIVLRFTTPGWKDAASGSRLDFQTSLAGPGTPVSGSTSGAEALNSGIVIGRFGADAHSARGGATGTVQFMLDPPPPNPLNLLQPSVSISCQ